MATQVNVQFAPQVDLERGKATVAAVPGVLRVRQVFPDQDEDELRRMFVIDVDSSMTDAALASLRRSQLLVEVEVVPKRTAPRP